LESGFPESEFRETNMALKIFHWEKCLDYGFKKILAQ
jgi:hypothetical protein